MGLTALTALYVDLFVEGHRHAVTKATGVEVYQESCNGEIVSTDVYVPVLLTANNDTGDEWWGLFNRAEQVHVKSAATGKLLVVGVPKVTGRIYEYHIGSDERPGARMCVSMSVELLT